MTKQTQPFMPTRDTDTRKSGLSTTTRWNDQAGAQPVTIPPAQLDIEIVLGDDDEFSPGVLANQDVEASSSGGKDVTLEGVRRKTPRLTPHEVEQLAAAKPALIAWLKAAPDNARHFVLHPVDALAQAKPELSRGLLIKLDRIRKASSPGAGPALDFELREVSLVDSDARGKETTEDCDDALA